MKRIASILLMSLALLFLMGCQSVTDEVVASELDSQKSSEIKREDSIDTYIIPDGKGDWGAPTPYGLLPRGPGFIRLSFVFDGLLWKDAEGQIVPALAQEWSFDESNRVYTFVLNKEAKWHDGQPVTAKDVAFTIDYIKNHPLEWVDVNMIGETKVIDDQTIALYMTENMSAFYSSVGVGMPILPAHIYKGVKSPELGGNEMAIGSGPYKLVSYSAEKGEYVLQAFDDYYQGQPKVNVVIFTQMNPQLQPAAFLQKQVNALAIDGEAEDFLKGSDATVVATKGMVTKLAYNHHKAPFSSKEFRQAIAYMIDKDAIRSIALRGRGIDASSGAVPMDVPYYNDTVDQYDLNIEKADALLKTLGYEKVQGFYAKDGVPLEVDLLGYASVERVMEVIVQQLKQVGIKAKVIIKEQETADQDLMDSVFDMAIVETGGLGDPEFLNRNIIGGSFTSDRYTGSQEMTDLLEKQVIEMDLKKRHQLLYDFQTLYSDLLPSYHLYYSEYIYAFDDILKLKAMKEGVYIGIPSVYNKMAFVD